jgi:hypothetical protein
MPGICCPGTVPGKSPAKCQFSTSRQAVNVRHEKTQLHPLPCGRRFRFSHRCRSYRHRQRGVLPGSPANRAVHPRRPRWGRLLQRPVWLGWCHRRPRRWSRRARVYSHRSGHHLRLRRPERRPRRYSRWYRLHPGCRLRFRSRLIPRHRPDRGGVTGRGRIRAGCDLDQCPVRKVGPQNAFAV